VQSELSPIALLAEASTLIGSGHIAENFHIAQAALRFGIRTRMWINRDVPPGLLEYAPIDVKLVDDFQPENLFRIASDSISVGCKLAITNFRRISNDQVHALQTNALKILCIDELGGSHLDCDIVVNPSIVSGYHHYTSDNPNFRVMTGPRYLAMSEEYERLNSTPKYIPEKIRSIIVTMGGTDRSGATLNIIRALDEFKEDTLVNVVIGGGFAHAGDLQEHIGSKPHPNVVVHSNLKSLGQFLFDSDIGFTAGGNTLAEMACVGTPALVLYEDPHEKDHGMAFQEKGFGVCIGRGADSPIEMILKALEDLSDRDRRDAFSRAGRELVDGKGAERILDAALELM
jgi:UDP-2,4-diacetamido-2,4,6-trideoxy-beta-L-altropyranose hydrolase